MSLARLLCDEVRIPLEHLVSSELGRTWRALRARDMHEAASHPAAILTDDTYSVFVKLTEGSLARDQAASELAGLRYLPQHAGVLTPTGIGIIEAGGGVLLVMEAVDVVPRTDDQWRQMGHALAKIHSVKGDHCGFASHTYWGPFYQDNSPTAEWVAFFRERRIAPRLEAAIASGHLPSDVVPYIERLSAQLDDLCGPPITPSLLHGDSHHNNFLDTVNGPVLIDPAIYFGHPEMDLAFVDFFAPVPDALLDGYREVTTVDVGFVSRRDLWRIPAWLAMVEMDGPQHVTPLMAALRSYA
jgi:protein-ribulosamine 3-kinase